MLPKIYRFTSRQDFAEVKRSGRLISGPLWGMLVKKKDATSSTCFGFIVSKKIDKRAVVRNHLRRQMSGAILTLLPVIKSGWGVIFLVKKNLYGQEFDDIKKEMARCLKNLS